MITFFVSYCTSASGYFPFNDNEYGRIRYDDNGDHAEHDTEGSADLRMSLRTASSTMMGFGLRTS